ncbi:MAG: alpha-E domain-containing protein [Saprospiraceae bacterium]|nr:alpha-E domain-containing protein [Saprospiraceae bacterium]
MFDLEVLSQGGENIPLMQYQWTITLKSLESFDMHNKFYHNTTSTQSVVEFLIANSSISSFFVLQHHPFN